MGSIPVPQDRLPIANGDGTSTIKLTKGLVTIIDTADAPLVRHLIWHASRSHTGFYARCSLRGPGKGVQLHRLLLDPPDGLQVDHINGDKLDNRRQNLRVVTASENMRYWAKRALQTPRTGFVGVTQTPRGRWVAQLCVSRQIIYLGTFDTVHEAALAYDDAAVRIRGDKVGPNFGANLR